MPSEKNIKQVEELTDELKRAKGIYFTDYLGLNVEDITILRKEFFEKMVCPFWLWGNPFDYRSKGS